MKVVIAIDSLKGSLSSIEAGMAIKEGVLRAKPDARIVVKPLADGGEGTARALTQGMHGHMETVTVTGPLGDPVKADYGIIGDTAVIEMAAAAGITLVPASRRNPLYTTTYGVGELILDAMEKNCRHFIIGIGGSATNDCGVGMLQALGFVFSDRNGTPVSFGADGVKDIAAIDNSHVSPLLSRCDFRIACDVTNPLCGSQGCSAVFGPQKGADPAMISQMDAWLSAFAALTKVQYPNVDPSMPGSGAAGGLGFAFSAYLGATLQSGISIVLEETQMEAAIKEENAFDGVSVIVARRPCMLLDKKSRKSPLSIKADACRNCLSCMKLGCPAIERMEKGVRINPDLCVGCGHCQNVCPFGAIVEGSEAK